MNVREVMKRNVRTIESQETVATAAAQMLSDDVGCLVVTSADKVEGILTDRDMAVRCTSQGHDPKRCRVADHMTTPVTYADPNGDILDAVRTMSTQQITRMPVMGRYRMIGIVSASDLAFALNRPLQDLLQGAGGRRHKY